MLFLAETNEEGLEYCQLESFKAQCSKSELVMMTMAKYGHMRVGKCITEEEASLGIDKKYSGCYRDVLETMHSKCLKYFKVEGCLKRLKARTGNSFMCVQMKYCKRD